jgi:hypothetical protein
MEALAIILLFIVLAIVFKWGSKLCFKLRDSLFAYASEEAQYRQRLLQATETIAKEVGEEESKIDVSGLRDKKDALEDKLTKRDAIMRELEIN